MKVRYSKTTKTRTTFIKDFLDILSKIGKGHIRLVNFSPAMLNKILEDNENKIEEIIIILK